MRSLNGGVGYIDLVKLINRLWSRPSNSLWSRAFPAANRRFGTVKAFWQSLCQPYPNQSPVGGLGGY
jgi:hypothetical protein